MARPQLVAALVVVGAFIAGAAVGALGDRALHPNRTPFRGSPREYWDRATSDWGLSQSQRHVIDSLLDAQHAKVVALYRPLRPSLDSVNARVRLLNDSTNTQLRAILTPEQQGKLDAMRAEMHRRDSARRHFRDSTDGGAPNR